MFVILRIVYKFFIQQIQNRADINQQSVVSPGPSELIQRTIKFFV